MPRKAGGILPAESGLINMTYFEDFLAGLHRRGVTNALYDVHSSGKALPVDPGCERK